MAPITDIINVTVSTTGAALQVPALNVPLILGASARFPERARSYTVLADMEADGFLVTDPEHVVAAAMLAADANNQVDTFVVGRLAHVPVQTIDITPKAMVAGASYSFELGGPGSTSPVVVTATADSTPTVAEIVAAWVTAVGAVTGLPFAVTASNQTTFLRLTVAAGGIAHVKSLNRTLVWIGESTADAGGTSGVADDLNAIQQYQPNFYGVLSPWNSPAFGTAIAIWADANKKTYVADCNESASAGTAATSATDLMAVINSGNHGRSIAILNQATDSFKGAAWMGLMFTKDPGADANWAYKTLGGQTADDWTPNELSNILARNGNYYVTYAGRGATYNGKAGGGKFFDYVPWFVDWQVSDIETEVATIQLNADSVPYTNAGAHQLAAGVERSLARGVAKGGLTTDVEPKVNVADVSTASSNDRANRIFSGITATALVSGSINKTQLRVQLS